MRRILIVTTGFLLFAVGLVRTQQTAPATPIYASTCATCHGAMLNGGSGPAILAYERYHIDTEVTATLRAKHANLTLSDTQMRQLLAEMRILAGTNPTMATGGLTGRREGPLNGNAPAGRGGRGGAAEDGPAPAGAGPGQSVEQDLSTRPQTTIKMADGKTRTGAIVTQSG